MKVFISGARRGVTRTIARLLRRRSAIEPMIDHMKNDGRLTFRHLRDFLRLLIWLIISHCRIIVAKVAPNQRDQ